MSKQQIIDEMKSAPAGTVSAKDLAERPDQIIKRYGMDEYGSQSEAEQLIRQKMQEAPKGTYTSKDLMERPAQIIKRYGGDPESLRSMGIEVKEPDTVQRFSGGFLDLSKTPQVYPRFVELTYGEPHPDYDNKNLGESLKEISSDQNVFPKLKLEERKAAVDNVIFDYEQNAKEKLTNEFPVLLHEIDVKAKNPNRNFDFVPTQSTNQ